MVVSDSLRKGRYLFGFNHILTRLAGGGSDELLTAETRTALCRCFSLRRGVEELLRGFCLCEVFPQKPLSRLLSKPRVDIGAKQGWSRVTLLLSNNEHFMLAKSVREH